MIGRRLEYAPRCVRAPCIVGGGKPVGRGDEPSSVHLAFRGQLQQRSRQSQRITIVTAITKPIALLFYECTTAVPRHVHDAIVFVSREVYAANISHRVGHSLLAFLRSE